MKKPNPFAKYLTPEQKEQWETIPNLDPGYKISNLGNLARESVSVTVPTGVRQQEYIKILPARELSSTLKDNGYFSAIFRRNSKGVRMYVHRLVALAFIDNPENLPEVNHINGIKTDNRAKNLEWCTRQKNMDHASVSGLLLRGEGHTLSKLTEKDIISIREDKRPQSQIAIEYGVCQQLISLIKNRKSWKHVA